VKKILLVITKIFSILIAVIMAIFVISIPISASMIQLEPPSVKSVKVNLLNDTLILFTNFTVKNNGFYDLEDISISVAILTLNDLLITQTHIGYPLENIIIKAHSSYNGSLKINFNLRELSNLGIIDVIKKDKAVKIQIASEGRYALALFGFKLNYFNKFSFTLPIEEIKILINFPLIFSKENLRIINDEIFARMPVIILFKGYLTLENIFINGYAMYSNIKMFDFNAIIDKLSEGENKAYFNLIMSKQNFIILISKDFNLKLFYQIKAKNIDYETTFDYFWKKPLAISLENINILFTNKTLVSINLLFNVKSNLSSNLNITFQIKIYYQETNKLLALVEKDIIIIANQNNEYNLNIFIGTLSHNSKIRAELYLLKPIIIEQPVATQIFIIP
jgi:LEA14-like dessication related protein